MKLSPQMRARLTAARNDLAARSHANMLDWSDDQCLSALSLINAGHSVCDAVAIVLGDAVLEDGQVDYNPGCAWIDFALARRDRTPAQAENILAHWESLQLFPTGSTEALIRDPGNTATPSQTGHALY
ncbi:hypothetical protein [Sphingomonas glacialis]|nr:hypothetical protein [Sphingomonas glacialis]